jgi:hypothetical protein
MELLNDNNKNNNKHYGQPPSRVNRFQQHTYVHDSLTAKQERIFYHLKTVKTEHVHGGTEPTKKEPAPVAIAL